MSFYEFRVVLSSADQRDTVVERLQKELERALQVWFGKEVEVTHVETPREATNGRSDPQLWNVRKWEE